MLRFFARAVCPISRRRVSRHYWLGAAYLIFAGGLVFCAHTSFASEERRLVCDIKELAGSEFELRQQPIEQDLKYDLSLELEEYWLNITVGVIRQHHRSPLYAASELAISAEQRLALSHAEYRRIWQDEMFHHVSDRAEKDKLWQGLDGRMSIWDARFGSASDEASVVGLWTAFIEDALFMVSLHAMPASLKGKPMSSDQWMAVIDQVLAQCQLRSH